jgi:hypothetical protein
MKANTAAEKEQLTRRCRFCGHMKNVLKDNGKTGVNAIGFHCELNLSKGDETAKTCPKYYYFDEINLRNKYFFYRENLGVQESIDSGITFFIMHMEQLMKENPTLGISDTVPKEAIAREVIKRLLDIPLVRIEGPPTPGSQAKAHRVKPIRYSHYKPTAEARAAADPSKTDDGREHDATEDLPRHEEERADYLPGGEEL